MEGGNDSGRDDYDGLSLADLENSSDGGGNFVKFIFIFCFLELDNIIIKLDY